MDKNKKQAKEITVNKPKDRIIRLFLLSFFFIFLFSALFFNYLKASASFPHIVNYQGRLTNSSSSAVSDGSYNLKFQLFNTDTGGSALWTEVRCKGDYTDTANPNCTGSGTDDRVSITKGLFSTLLGSINTFGSLNFNQDLYLEIDVGGSDSTPDWVTLTPRKHLSASINALNANQLGGKDASLFAVLSDEDIITAPWRFNVSSNAPGITVNQAGLSNALAVNGTSLFMSLGTEKITNGTFDSTSNWLFSTGWALDSTNFEADHTSGTAALEQDVSAIVGEDYYVSFEVKNRTAGTVTPAVGGVSGTAISVNGLVSKIITASGTGNLQFIPSTDFDGSVDNVSVKKMNQGGDVYVMGKVGIGTTSSSDILTIESSTPSEKMIDSTNGSYTKLTKTDSNSLAARYNKIAQPSGIGRAVAFDGPNMKYASMPRTSIFDVGANSYSISLWIRSTSAIDDDTGRFFSTLADNVASGWGLLFHGGKVWYYSPVTNFTSSNRIDDGNWHNVVFVKETGVSRKIYIDNALVASDTVNGLSSDDDSDAPTVICQDGHYSVWGVKGDIDEVGWYNGYALNQTEVSGLYGGGSGYAYTGSEAGLSAYWTLDEGSGNILHDGMGSNDFTIFGSPPWIAGVAPASASTSEALVWKSENGSVAGENGIQTFGDTGGRTVLQGQTIRLSIGSSEKIRVDSNGNVGIGTTNTLANLTIAGLSPVEELIDNNNGSYTKLTKSDTNNEAVRKNSLMVVGSGSGLDSNTVLLLHMDGANSSTDFVDSSNSPKTVTSNGATVSTGKSVFGSASGSFGGGGVNYLSIPYSDDFSFGTGDFTIDFWVNFNSQGNYLMFVDRNSDLRFYKYGTQVVAGATSWTWPSANNSQWYHVAWVKSSGSATVYVDGVALGAPQADNVSYVNGEPLNIGTAYNQSQRLDGYIDELRISKGIARWTTSFTPPTQAYSNGLSFVQEAQVWDSVSSSDPSEKGIQTFGDGSGRTVMDGKTIRFDIGSSEKIMMDENGNLGIGTSSPASALHVIGGVCIEGTDSGCAQTGGNLKVGGTIDSVGGFKVNGVAGLSSQTITVGVDGGGTCTITVVGGIITATTCS